MKQTGFTISWRQRVHTEKIGHVAGNNRRSDLKKKCNRIRHEHGLIGIG